MFIVDMKLSNIFNFLKKEPSNLQDSSVKNSLKSNRIEKISLNQMEKELETIDISKQTKTKKI